MAVKLIQPREIVQLKLVEQLEQRFFNLQTMLCATAILELDEVVGLVGRRTDREQPVGVVLILAPLRARITVL